MFLELNKHPPSDKENIMATKKKAAKAVEPAEVEDFEGEEVEAEEAPAKAKKAAPKRPEIAFGTKELADHVNEATGSSYDAYQLRILLRKLAKEGVIERDETTGRARYSFTGPKDPQVKAIVKAVKEGAAEKAKEERLEGLKEKRKASKPGKKKATKAKPAPEPELDEDELDVEDL